MSKVNFEVNSYLAIKGKVNTKLCVENRYLEVNAEICAACLARLRRIVRFSGVAPHFL